MINKKASHHTTNKQFFLLPYGKIILRMTRDDRRMRLYKELRRGLMDKEIVVRLHSSFEEMVRKFPDTETEFFMRP
jgi:hypothetical protein